MIGLYLSGELLFVIGLPFCSICFVVDSSSQSLGLKPKMRVVDQFKWLLSPILSRSFMLFYLVSLVESAIH